MANIQDNGQYLEELKSKWNDIWDSAVKNTKFFSSYQTGYDAGTELTSNDWNWGKLSNKWEAISKQFSSSNNPVNILSSVLNSIGLAAGEGIGTTVSAGTYIGQNYDEIMENISSAMGSAASVVNNVYGSAVDVAESEGKTLNNIFDSIGSKSNSVILSVITKGLSIFADGVLNTYKDGVSETSFGNLMESSWNKSANSFIKTFKSSDNSTYKINFLNSTPLDPGDDITNLYGTMMLGTPPLFNHITDPRNRILINKFLKDSRFLSLTPGMPKFNGSSYLMKTNEDQMHQTQTGESMLQYLLRNGVDSYFASKDKRYYTFKEDYDDYYAYLETMLNAIWIKMGLATENNSTFNIYSFFNNDTSTPQLLSKYRQSLGFLISNPSGILTESINTSPTSFGNTYAGEVNSNSDLYQQILFNSGQGSGDNVRKASLKIANIGGLASNLAGFVTGNLSNTLDAIGTKSSTIAGNIAKYAVKIPLAIAKDTTTFLTEKDQGAVLQSFATTNGMKVVYPELWSDSSFSRTVNINFEFISPYGDPMSIFKYVMVPFAALLTFAMPRQAADNGIVSPFFIRADVPGLFTTDLGLITDFTWTRGGNQDLWSKDGIPRAISGSFTISDLYPYLSMTKRLSFMSANPNYTVFIDNLAGLHSVYENDDVTDLTEYWKQMLNRVNGESSYNKLWNNYSADSRESHSDIANNSQTNRINGKGSSIDWLRGFN